MHLEDSTISIMLLSLSQLVSCFGVELLCLLHCLFIPVSIRVKTSQWQCRFRFCWALRILSSKTPKCNPSRQIQNIWAFKAMKKYPNTAHSLRCCGVSSKAWTQKFSPAVGLLRKDLKNRNLLFVLSSQTESTLRLRTSTSSWTRKLEAVIKKPGRPWVHIARKGSFIVSNQESSF